MKIPTWSDSNGRQWPVVITVGKLRLTRELVGVDLLQALDGDLIADLLDDPFALTSVLWAICHRQAKKLGIALQQFERSMVGDAMDQGAFAIVSGLMDFFLRSQRKARHWETIPATN